MIQKVLIVGSKKKAQLSENVGMVNMTVNTEVMSRWCF